MTGTLGRQGRIRESVPTGRKGAGNALVAVSRYFAEMLHAVTPRDDCSQRGWHPSAICGGRYPCGRTGLRSHPRMLSRLERDELRCVAVRA